MFVDYCASTTLPVLDIGAAYGVASIPALATGATVIANDSEMGHLRVLRDNTPEQDRRRLVLIGGKFPRHVHLAEESLEAVHASNVLHFLTGPQLANGAASIAHWLCVGGKAFIQASTPWQKPFEAFLPEFERRVEEGVEWPGWIEDAHARFDHPKISQIPNAIHLLDPATLSQVFVEAGLEIERCWLYSRRDLAKGMRFDGRESLGLIAVKRGPLLRARP